MIAHERPDYADTAGTLPAHVMATSHSSPPVEAGLACRGSKDVGDAPDAMVAVVAVKIQTDVEASLVPRITLWRV